MQPWQSKYHSPAFTTMLRQLQMAEHPTPVQMQILDYLEKVEAPGYLCLPGCGSPPLSQYVLWKLFNNPDEKILIVSASLSRAEAAGPGSEDDR